MDVEQGESETVHLKKDDDEDFLPDLDKSFANISIDRNTIDKIKLEDDEDEDDEHFKDEDFDPNTHLLAKTPSSMHSIKCKLSSIKVKDEQLKINRKSADLFNFIQQQVVYCTKLTSEAWDLANYYVIDCLDNNKQVEVLNGNFFMHCFALLGWCKGAKSDISENLKSSFKKLRLNTVIELTKNSGDLFRNRTGIDGIFQAIATQMVTNTDLMLRLFKIRLRKWLNLTNDYGDGKERYKHLNDAFLAEYENYKDCLFNKKDEKTKKYLNNDFTHNSSSLTIILKKLRIIQNDFSIMVNKKKEY